MAYRGRVLVELSTQLDGKIDKNVEDICSDDILVAQVCKVTVHLLLYSFGHQQEGQGFFLLKWKFASFLRDQALPFCKADKPDCNRCPINKVRLNSIQCQPALCWNGIMFQPYRNNNSSF